MCGMYNLDIGGSVSNNHPLCGAVVIRKTLSIRVQYKVNKLNINCLVVNKFNLKSKACY